MAAILFVLIVFAFGYGAYPIIPTTASLSGKT